MVGQRVGDRPGRVFVHQIDARSGHFARQVDFDLLDNQCPDDLPILGIHFHRRRVGPAGALLDVGTPQRQDGNRLGV